MVVKPCAGISPSTSFLSAAAQTAAAGQGGRRARRSGRRGVASPVLAFEVAPIVGYTASCALEGAAKSGQHRRSLLARLRPGLREQAEVLFDQAGDGGAPPGGVALGSRHDLFVHAQVSLPMYVSYRNCRTYSVPGSWL